MSNLAVAILMVVGIIVVIFIIICCFEGPCYKAKIIVKDTDRFEVWFYYIGGSWENYDLGWCQLYYKEFPLKFSGNDEFGKFKEATFKTLEEAERIKSMYEYYIYRYGGID